MTVSNLDIEQCVLDPLGRRADTASICPSEVARALVRDGDAWRALMPAVRHTAARLARQQSVLITQGDVTLNPDSIGRGPVRLRRGPRFPATG
jgi:hypothetical protein